MKKIWDDRAPPPYPTKRIVDPIRPPGQQIFYAETFLSGSLTIPFSDNEEHDGKEYRHKYPVELKSNGRGTRNRGRGQTKVNNHS